MEKHWARSMSTTATCSEKPASASASGLRRRRSSASIASTAAIVAAELGMGRPPQASAQAAADTSDGLGAGRPAEARQSAAAASDQRRCFKKRRASTSSIRGCEALSAGGPAAASCLDVHPGVGAAYSQHCSSHSAAAAISCVRVSVPTSTTPLNVLPDAGHLCTSACMADQARTPGRGACLHECRSDGETAAAPAGIAAARAARPQRRRVRMQPHAPLPGPLAATPLRRRAPHAPRPAAPGME